MIIRARSKDGHSIDVGTIHVRDTYLGLLEGYVPPDQWFAEVVSETEEQTGQRVHALRPETQPDPFNPERRRLPPVTLQAELTSDPLQDEWCASRLTVLWFENDVSSVPLTDLVQRVVADLQWADLAQGFDY